MNENTFRPRFIYDEKTNALYAPDGRFLKHIYCPKALHWNQLLVTDAEDRSRHCSQCKGTVLNLDALSVEEAISKLEKYRAFACLHATAEGGNVVFLEDMNALPRPAGSVYDQDGRLIILTARTYENINRAAAMGYWPDVRWIVYDTTLRKKLAVAQDSETGEILFLTDYRHRHHEGKQNVVLDFEWYYPHFQSIPVAAYLIPRDVADGTEVTVVDPIEDIKSGSWNQGDVFRAKNVPGRIEQGKVVLHKSNIKQRVILGQDATASSVANGHATFPQTERLERAKAFSYGQNTEEAMRQFNLFGKGRFIEWNHLENVDPHRYQASGKFTPAGDYDKVMAEIAAMPGARDLPVGRSTWAVHPRLRALTFLVQPSS
ncbi:hypothetical protein [Halothiobacillus sp. DCM-1]|uniref:hypothetical protein n=1 Tax=Halothiobacillus sp. DCM-1 TaxID=3112558 RepID=UPI0032447CA0